MHAASELASLPAEPSVLARLDAPAPSLAGGHDEMAEGS